MSVLLVLLYAVCLLLLTMYLRFRWQYRHVLATAAKLPCPPTLPIIGNALFFFGDITGCFKQLQYVGERSHVYSLFRPFLGNSIISSPVHIWKKYRRLMNPVMHPSNVEHFLPVFNEVSRKLTEQFSVSSPPSDRTDEIFEMAVNGSTGSIFSRKLFYDNIKEIKFGIDSVGKLLILRLFKFWLHFDWLFKLLYWKELKESFKIRDKCMDVISQEWKDGATIKKGVLPGENQNTERLSGLNLVDVMFENLPIVLDDHDWMDEFMTIITGASDTTVSALSFLLFTIGHHPEVQERMFMEIQEVMGDLDRDVTAADVNAMKYLDQVILESIRLHGNIVLIMRRATNDTKIDSCTLPAGSRVLIILHAMGWNKERFPNPEQFLPERFCPEQKKLRHNYSFLPFSAGPRNCIGKAYAMVILKTVLVHILRRLRVKSHTKMSDIVYELRAIMYSKTPLLVTFQPR
ncbi:cytochrome P450 4g15-like [Homalodisca vitripennis]|uniref:cytochrome P450 4g15-like n=1 Tax=Homalodisca vitripennis TaxID=197043 RepID=UPI001EEA9C80|nr:cytochrome P450 4g15-like [Homalodisca vitripennis]